eukprot:GEMP01031744.1.p1 GENE.GEMP01031744.1~~GEMP01031744.1.p1  ORF type:complete len:437 (+),score=87.21 GEMP01031744.1:16-1326(+)
MWLLLYPLVPLVWGTCRDSSDYVGDWGESCLYWKGKDCQLLPESRGASKLGQDLLRCKCPVTCRVNKDECFIRDESGKKVRLGYPTSCPVCKELRAGRHHNNCRINPLRRRGETCVFNYQCLNSYCCPHLRVCLDGAQDRLFIQELEAFGGVEKARIVASPLGNRRACEPTGDNLMACLQDSASPYGHVTRTYNLTRCNCKESFLHMVHRNQWVPCPEVPEESLLCTDFERPPVPPPPELDVIGIVVGSIAGALVVIFSVSYSIYVYRRNAKRVDVAEQLTIDREHERRVQLVLNLQAEAEANTTKALVRRTSIAELTQTLNSPVVQDILAIEAAKYETHSSSGSSFGGTSNSSKSGEEPVDHEATFNSALERLMTAPLGSTEEEKEAIAMVGRKGSTTGRARGSTEGETGERRKSWVLVRSSLKLGKLQSSADTL